ncbi:MAG: hypothetical protein ACJ8FI_11625 [Sphingomicrobium sp.]
MWRVVLLLFLTLATQGCGQKDRAVRLNGAAYFFPGLHIDAFLDPTRTGSHEYYIRLIPPGGYYWLVYDPSRERRPNTLGPGVPTIAHISDWNLTVIPKEEEVQLVKNEAGVVVCKKHPVNDDSAYMREDFTCGFRVYDNGVPWSVIIPGDLVASAPALKRRAEITLTDYRRDKRAEDAR